MSSFFAHPSLEMAEMDMYPPYLPWAFGIPSVARGSECDQAAPLRDPADGKVPLHLAWRCDSSFADVIGAVIRQIERVHRTADLR
jgi:hypothetical protein